MRLRPSAISAVKLPKLVMLGLVLLTLASLGCKSSDLPPAPATLINNTRDRLNPFRFTMTTDPASPTINNHIAIKVHVIDAVNQPADGVDLQADLSMPAGMAKGPQHISFSGQGNGDYEGEVDLDTAGSWDMDLTAAKDGKTKQQRLSIDVGG